MPCFILIRLCQKVAFKKRHFRLLADIHLAFRTLKTFEKYLSEKNFFKSKQKNFCEKIRLSDTFSDLSFKR